MTDFKWPDETLYINWSGEAPVPQIGEHVKTYINGMGAGTVVGYFVEHGYLGVTIELDNPPKWFLAQSTTGAIGHFFGIDLTPATKSKDM